VRGQAQPQSLNLASTYITAPPTSDLPTILPDTSEM
jgi:hypothetical protein